MHIRDQLLVAHSRDNADLILDYLYAHPDRVAELMDAFLEDEYRVVQRAAMVVGDLGRAHPDWLQTYHSAMVAAANEAKHPAVRRNVLRYFSELPLPQINEATEGPLLDLAFRLTESPTEAVAIRVHAMQIVFNFCAKYPELKNELRDAIEGGMEDGSAGFRSRGGKILVQLGDQ